jgi:hypothetical protein
LVNWRSVKGTVRSARSIQDSSLKSRISFIDIIDEASIHRSKNAVSRMTRKL